MNLEKVSVIVPCYNQAQFLDEALQSILNQTYSNWECFIVDDGSLDDTEKVAKQWCERDTRFKYLYKENGGLSSARNFGIQKTIGTYILTLDADDKYESTFLKKASTLLNNEPEIGVVSSWGIRFSENNQYDVFKPEGGGINQFLLYNASIGTSMFRKRCWEEIGGYDESMKKGYEDWEFYIRLCDKGWSVHIIPEILFFYRQHPVSMRTVAITNYDKQIKEYIYNKHRDLYIANYGIFISHLLSKIEREEREKIKHTQRIEFQIGKVILKPFRWCKLTIKLINLKKNQSVKYFKVFKNDINLI